MVCAGIVILSLVVETSLVGSWLFIGFVVLATLYTMAKIFQKNLKTRLGI